MNSGGHRNLQLSWNSIRNSEKGTVHMKVGFFTDSHYSSQAVTCTNRYNNQSLRKILEAYDYFVRENCDLVICLGDLTDKDTDHAREITNLQEMAEVIHSCPIPTICLMGNHDAFSFTADAFYDILGCRPQTMEAEGKRLIFLDACYFKSGQHYQPGDSDWTDTFYPFTPELKQQLAGYDGDIYVFLHQNIDPTIRQDHMLHNAAEINRILAESGRVKAVFQGHYHWGKTSSHGGIRYITFPAMCENEHCYFVDEL